jgi:eukaryotic-like serine/threonine-protein kinase
MAERYPEAEMVLDDELVYDEGPRRSSFLRREERPEDIVREGEVLAGKYRVERIPGRNGLGVLVQVRHLELGQEVTLKFLVPEACAYPEFVQRFVREARAAVRIQGEHVARVTDVGRLESGAPYMVREYLRGPDLAEVLKVRGPLPIPEAVDYIIQACEGVAEGHALGVVHRNLRPTSLVVARRSDGLPLVKVFDFAASETLHVNPFTERAVSLVGTSAIMASLPYLAPEQIRDPHDVDFRADVYSLGAVLFELLTGTPVYSADAAPALLAQVAADAAPSVRTLRPDVPGELDHTVLRCLAKNRAIRFASIAELALALAPFASEEMSGSVDHIVRLGKRTSKIAPDRVEERGTSSLPPVPASRPLSAPPARGPRGTLPIASPDAPDASRRAPLHDDVTTVNPLASQAAHAEARGRAQAQSARADAARFEPVRATAHVRDESRRPTPQSEPARADRLAELDRTVEPPVAREPRHTPEPPPLRASVPPPLQGAHASHATPVPLPRPDTTALPPPRSSIPGLSRSWAVPEEEPRPLFTQKRLLALGGVAAAVTLVGFLAWQRPQAGAPAAAAAPASASPPKVTAEPAAQPAPPPVALQQIPPGMALVNVPGSQTPILVPLAAASPAPSTSAAPEAREAPVATERPATVAPPPPIARRPAPPPQPAAESAPRKPAPAAEKVAVARPSARDLFDDPN